MAEETVLVPICRSANHGVYLLLVLVFKAVCGSRHCFNLKHYLRFCFVEVSHDDGMCVGSGFGGVE